MQYISCGHNRLIKVSYQSARQAISFLFLYELKFVLPNINAKMSSFKEEEKFEYGDEKYGVDVEHVPIFNGPVAEFEELAELR